MIEAYMDESGIHDGAHVCVVAGYWGLTKKWKRFESQWSQIIEGAKEPTLKEFHSTKFWYADGTRKGIFAQGDDSKAEEFVDDLVSCIVETNLFPTSAVLVIEDWKKLNKYERMFLTGGYYDLDNQHWITTGAPNKTYFLPFQFAVVGPAIHCRAGLHVNYTFDLNKQFKNHVVDLYTLLKSDQKLQSRHRLGALDLEESQRAVGLQAADLLAYQTYKFSKLRLARKEPFKSQEVPQLLRRLITNRIEDDDFPFFDTEGLNVALHNLPAHMRSPGWKPVRLKPVRRVIW